MLEKQYDLIIKFKKISSFVEKNNDTMHHKASISWTNPNLPTCKVCGKEKYARLVIPENDHKNINWHVLDFKTNVWTF